MNKGKEKKICPACYYENEMETRYCQRCGGYFDRHMTLRDLFSDPEVVVANIGGINDREVSLMPLGGFTIKGFERAQNTKIDDSFDETGVRVRPLSDGSWYCPDCGAHNSFSSLSCKECGKYK